MARFPTSTDCLCVRLKEARKLGFVVYIAGTMCLFLNLNLAGVTFTVSLIPSCTLCLLIHQI